MTPEWKVIGDRIYEDNGKKYRYSISEAAKILGIHPNHVAHEYSKAGILVQTNGNKKYVTAWQLGELMCANRVSPV